MTAGQAQAPDQPRGNVGMWVGWAAILALAAWLRVPAPGWLALAGAATLVFAALAPSGLRGWTAAIAITLWLGIGTAAGISVRLARVENAWPAVRERVEEEAAAALRMELDALRARADTAATQAARQPISFSRLERIRARTGISALVVYGADGTPLAWAGEHRGEVPEVVRKGERAYEFARGPLFGYAYFARPMAGDRTAVGAVLLESNLAAQDDLAPFAERFRSRHGILPRFTFPERARGHAIWDWMADRTIFSVTFATLTQARWRDRVVGHGLGAVGAVWIAALVGMAFLGRRIVSPRRIVLAAAAGLLIAPVPQLFGAEGIPDGPFQVAVMAMLGAAFWLVGVREQPGWSRGALRAAVVLAAALVVPGALLLVRHYAPPAPLADASAGSVWLQLVTVLLIALPLWVLLRTSPARDRAGHPAAIAAVAMLPLLLAGGVLAWSPVLRTAPVWTGALWALPFALLLWAIPVGRSPRSALLGWLAVGWIAASAALPHLWLLHWQARLQEADAELARLGTQPDPLLDSLLREFAERSLFFASEGERGVDLLYRSWVASGLASEGYEARVTLWNGTSKEAELGLSDLELPADMVPGMLAAAREAEEPVVQRFTDRRAVHYLLAMSIPGGRVVSVAVPPRRRLDRATALARFIDPTESGDRGELTSLSLVPVPPQGTPASPRWVRTAGGWRSEVRVPFPEGPMHAHLLIGTPPPLLLGARTLLLASLHLAILALLWIAGRAFAGFPLGETTEGGWIRTFRGRLTLALFAFFLLPTLVFSATAYRALSREVVRTAEALASRSLEQAVDEGPEVPISVLGEHVRADLLLYRRGALVDAASPEVIDLGLYPTWLPRNMFLAFRSGETLDTVEQRRLGGQPYLLAYHQRGPDAVLAAPVPLVSGDTAQRQRELADIVLLAALFGAALSFALSLLVGRALSAPIERLSRAAAAIGGGDLDVRLPEERPDEFGGLYRSFNRMVQRLRQARSAEVRTARVLAWGEMARQVAHEIKNPLTPIKLSVQHLRRAYRDGRPDYGEILDRNVEGVLREIDQLSEIARAFARFGTPAEAAGPLEPVDLPNVLADTLALYRGGEDGIAYQLEIPPDTPFVCSRAGELKEVLINLLENSRAALDGTGEIAIRAATAESDWVQLEIADTGTGISPDALPHIFEPQFSTRTSGTGLGLAIVRRLVEGWGGEIRAESEPGVGTTMRIRLRVAPSPEQA